MYTASVLLSLGWPTLLGLVVVALLAWEVCWIIYCRTYHPLAHIPGPFLASFSRVWIWKQARQGQMHETQLYLHKQHGHLVRIAPNEVSCADPMAVKELYRVQQPLEKSDFYHVWQNTAFGKHKDNFSVINETEHASRRRIVNPVYSLSNVLQSEPYIDVCSRLFVQKLGKFADGGIPIDMGRWLQMYAFDVIGELYFGQMFGFLEKEIDYQNLIRSLDTLNPIIGSAAVSASYARPMIMISAVASSSVRSGLKAIDHVVSVAKSCVKKRQDELDANKTGGEQPRRDLLQQLFEIMHEKGEKVDFGIPEIQYEAYVALFAGSDTTAIAMRSVFYHLSRSPKTQTALLEEIDAAFPSDTHPLQEPIKYADAVKLPLLCATIKEGMRLHPSVGFTMPRVSPAPSGLHISGTYVPPGYRVGINAHVLQRNKNVFGEDAEQFRPQRWLVQQSSVEQLAEMDRCMLHFGAGTRTCIGKNISLSEMHKIIPQILRNFELVPVDVNKPWTTHNHWFNKQKGLMYQFVRRT